VCVCVKKSFQFQCKKKKKESDECIKSKENPIKSNQTLAAFFFTNSNKVFLYEWICCNVNNNKRMCSYYMQERMKEF
jgi:hypothetical protein